MSYQPPPEGPSGGKPPEEQPQMNPPVGPDPSPTINMGGATGAQPSQGRYMPPSPSGYTPPPMGGTGYSAAPPMRMGGNVGSRKLRRIDVLSAFKVGASLTALVWAILGLFFVLLSICGAGLMSSTFNRSGGILTGGIVGSLVFYVILVVVYAIVGGVVGALYAWLYNVTVNWTGGLQVDIEQV